MVPMVVWRGALWALLHTTAREPRDSATCLERLAGRWLGTGISYGQPVRDSAAFEWTMERRFLRVTYRAQQGDSFAAEGYLRHNAADGRVAFYEFSTGIRPIRILVGTCSADRLRLDEQGSERPVWLTFRFVDASTIEMTESELRAGQAVVVVREELKKTGP